MKHLVALRSVEAGTVAADVGVDAEVDVGVSGQRAGSVGVGALPEQRVSEAPVLCRESVASSEWQEWLVRS